MTIEERLRAYSDSMEKVQVEDDRLQETIRVSKAALYQSEMETPLSGMEFLICQAGYIRKRWWLAQAFVLLALWLFLFAGGIPARLQRCVGVVAPLFIILVMPELWKSRNYGCMEIEAASRFSIKKVYAARMLWLLTVDVLLLSLFFAASVLTTRVTLWEMIVQFLLPMNVTCSICFQGLCSSRTDSGYYALGMSLLWTGVWTLIVLQEKVYETVTAPVWAIAVLLSVLLCGCSIYRVWKKCGNYLEVNPIWN